MKYEICGSLVNDFHKNSVDDRGCPKNTISNLRGILDWKYKALVTFRNYWLLSIMEFSYGVLLGSFDT